MFRANYACNKLLNPNIQAEFQTVHKPQPVCSYLKLMGTVVVLNVTLSGILNDKTVPIHYVVIVLREEYQQPYSIKHFI